MHPMLTIAKRAADAAGKIIIKQFNHSSLNISSKQPNDFVTETDVYAEKAIIDVIHESFPTHAIWAEESQTDKPSEAEFCWVIDPIDGTANFINGFPHFAISIALLKKGKPEIGLVYQPITDELFMAARGQGATLNGRRIRIKDKPAENGIIATGFPFKNPSIMPLQMRYLQSIMQQFPDIRRAGSAALDLCYVASGRVDGYFEIGLEPWDIAAGALIAQESGAIVSDTEGQLDYINKGSIVAAPAKIYKKIIKITAKTND